MLRKGILCALLVASNIAVVQALDCSLPRGGPGLSSLISAGDCSKEELKKADTQGTPPSCKCAKALGNLLKKEQAASGCDEWGNGMTTDEIVAHYEANCPQAKATSRLAFHGPLFSKTSNAYAFSSMTHFDVSAASPSQPPLWSLMFCAAIGGIIGALLTKSLARGNDQWKVQPLLG